MIHPASRAPVCKLGGDCPNPDCERLHPAGWVARESNQHHLKTPEARRKDQERAALPILKCREEFVRRLRRDKEVIVKAETGSGKTTQLPQYAAEAFDGLIVCTQPRAIAALSIARRVADEFDGTDVGESVGYRVGGQRARGRRILLVTDASFISMAQKDRLVSDVSVLIVDEAHERSLNTDVVLAIAKQVRAARPNDFHVAVASATIDPAPFRDFFGRQIGVLDVPGRTFPVVVQNLPGAGLVQAVLDVMEDREEGHVLAFLPGSGEVDRAVKEFRARAPAEWVPLPLYGALPPEEQERVMRFDEDNNSNDNKGGGGGGGSRGNNNNEVEEDKDDRRRMVVFCTNVAETSLTVPGVRIVVDSGLAKEASYDPVRRITVLEEVLVSRSSADQRKGRAGRTAEGFCLRLFDEDDIKRESIEPEILRASLDKVVLHICRLRYDPLTIPLVSAPPRQVVASSMEALERMGCLRAGGEITPRGEAFLEVSFDPQLSQFVALAAERFGLAKLAAEIACVLSAPGSVFFMGGKEGREESRARIAKLAGKHESESDLLVLHGVYTQWVQSGSNRRARAKFAQQQFLNNKVLEAVDREAVRAVPLFQQRFPCVGQLGVHPPEEAIGKCLAETFPQQLGQLLVPSMPDMGVFLHNTKLKGRLQGTSTLVQRASSAHDLFVTMSVTRLPTGLVIVDQCHPVKPSWVKCAEFARLDMRECLVQRNVSGFLSRGVFWRIRELSDGAACRRAFQFAVALHDDKGCTLRVFAPSDHGPEVADECRAVLAAARQEQLDYEQVHQVADGTATATCVAGLRVTRVDPVGTLLRVRFANLPKDVDSDEALARYLRDSLHVRGESVRWSRLDKRRQHAVCVFRSKEVASRVVERAADLDDGVRVGHDASVAGPGPQRALGFVEWGVEWEVESELDEEAAKRRIAALGLRPTFVRRTWASKGGLLLKLSNLQPGTTKEQVQRVLGRSRVALSAIDVYQTRGKTFAKATFASWDERERASAGLADVQPSWRTANLEVRPLSKFAVRFSKQGDAEAFIGATGSKGATSARVEHAALFPDLTATATMLQEKFGLDKPRVYHMKGKLEGTVQVTFRGQSLVACGQAARQLSDLTMPIRMFLADRQQQLMVRELRKRGKLEEWACEEGVEVEELKGKRDDLPFQLRVYGPHVNKGQFMGRIADYSNRFAQRYKAKVLTPHQLGLFKNHRPGWALLRDLRKELPAGAWVQMVPTTRSIELLLPPDADEALMEQVLGDVDALCQEHKLQRIEDTECVFCKAADGQPMRICGHHRCRACLLNVLVHSDQFPITCPQCDTPISTFDFNALEHEQVRAAVSRSARAFVREQGSNRTFQLCPRRDCGAFLSADFVYGPCPSCDVGVCPDCGAVDAPAHDGIDCDMFERLGKVDLGTMVADAREFVSANWPFNLPKIANTHVNEGLFHECAALQRFRRAREKCPGASTFFTWHGSSEAGIVGICDQGFDPNRRTGQVHGPGEYFGVHAGISHGYMRGSGRMIVANVIRHERVLHTVAGFCVVVNNPQDWHLSYCLPVLVLTLDPNIGAPRFIIPAPVVAPKPVSALKPVVAPSLAFAVARPDSARATTAAKFRWAWRDDSGFRYFDDDKSALLEEKYAKYMQDPRHTRFELAFVRLRDAVRQVYVIDFHTSTQTNSATGYAREIRRHKVNSLSPLHPLVSAPSPNFASNPASYSASNPASYLANNPVSNPVSYSANNPASNPASYSANNPASYSANNPASYRASNPVSYPATYPASSSIRPANPPPRAAPVAEPKKSGCVIA